MKNLIKSAGKAYFRARGHYPSKIQGRSVRVDPYHIAFWRAVAKDRWETSTFDVISRYLTPESTYIDVGAWIGPTVLHAAQQCKTVYCFEPDPTALRHLNWNIELNKLRNVNVFGAALAANGGMFQMASFGGEAGDSMTSLLQTESEHFIKVLALTWQDFLADAQIEDFDLIKVDVEGAEFGLIPTMVEELKEKKPALFLSTHAPYLPAEDRQAGMAALVDALSFYPLVFDEFLNPIDPEEIKTTEAANAFGTYLFTFEEK